MYPIQTLANGCKNLCCLNHHSKYYLFDFYNCICLEVSPKLYDCIALLKQTGDNSWWENYEKELEFLSKALSKGFLLTTEQISEMPSDYANLCFTPGHECNFQCRYCFAQSGKTYISNKRSFSGKDIEITLNFFFTQMFPDAKRYRIDFISGGEPLLYFDTIKHTVEISEEFQQSSGKSVQIWLCTNGSLLTEEIVRYLDEHNVSIGISIDGDKEAHNANRVYKNGEGTYSDVYNGLRQVLEAPNVSNKVKHIWGLCVINESNHDLVRIVEHYRSLGIKTAQIKIEWRHFSSEEEAENYYSVLMASYTQFAEFLLFEFTKGNLDCLLMIINENDQFGKIVKRYITGVYASRRCEAGRSKVTICPNGDIYPCYSFVGIEALKMGNIYQHTATQSMCINVGINFSAKCKTCEIKYLCGGDCYYNSYMNSGTLTDPQEHYCQLQRYLCEIGIWLMCEMQKTDRVLFQKLEREVVLSANIRRQ